MLPLAAACLFTGCASEGAVSSSAPVSDTAASTSAVQTQQTAETEGTTGPVFRGGHHRRFSLPKHGSRRHGQNNAGQNDRRLQYGEAHDYNETGPPSDAAGSQGDPVDKQPDL